MNSEGLGRLPVIQTLAGVKKKKLTRSEIIIICKQLVSNFLKQIIWSVPCIPI